MILGAHVSVSGGIMNAFENALSVGCETFQIFTKNQNQWQERKFTSEEIYGFSAARVSGPFSEVPLASHDSYLINLCSTDEEKLQRSRAAFVQEIERCQAIGIDLLIFHPGSHLGQGEEWGLDLIAQSLISAISETENSTVRLLIETTAGQGSNLGYRFEHLARILDLVSTPERMGVCLDTCHIFAAGYDIREPETYDQTFAEFDRLIGLQHLFAFHLNDSKKGLGSKVDRHERIGQGEIGQAAFEFLCRDERFKKIPGYLEVPGGDDAFRSDLDWLKQMTGSGL